MVLDESDFSVLWQPFSSEEERRAAYPEPTSPNQMVHEFSPNYKYVITMSYMFRFLFTFCFSKGALWLEETAFSLDT